MSFHKITEVVIDALFGKNKIEIYYLRTENSDEGWRVIEPQSITTDIPPDGEELVPDEDRLSPGHILNAYDIDSGKKELKSFILGKIRQVRKFSK